MSKISVSEAAERLGVNVQRVHQRIADRSLAAEKIGSQWVIDEIDVARIDRRSAGRPLSSRSAWALALTASHEAEANSTTAPLPFPPAERSRARARLHHLLQDVAKRPDISDTDSADELAIVVRSLLKNRAQRLLFRSSPRDLGDLRLDVRIDRSGISLPGSGIAAGDIVEGYVLARDLQEIIADYILVEADHDRANVVLHVVGEDVEPQMVAEMDNWLVLAADLAEHHRPRETARAAQLLHEAARRHASGPRSADR